MTNRAYLDTLAFSLPDWLLPRLCRRKRESYTRQIIDLMFSYVFRDYWQYYEPIRQNMPQNCSADVQSVIAHVDQVLTQGSDQDKQSLRAVFGMEDVVHDDDVASDNCLATEAEHEDPK